MERSRGRGPSSHAWDGERGTTSPMTGSHSRSWRRDDSRSERRGRSWELPRDVLLDYCQSNLKMFVGERLVNKILGKSVFAHALGRAVVMHFEAQAGIGPRPTLTRLQRATGLGRTLAAFFAALRVARLVTVEVDVSDRRVKYIVPSTRVVEGLRGWNEVQLEYGERFGFIPAGHAKRLREDDAYSKRFLCCSRHILENIHRTIEGVPLWTWLSGIDCGDRIGYGLLRLDGLERAKLARNVEGPVWFPFSSVRMAADLGVSKSHVRNVVNAAEERGFLKQDYEERALALTDAFFEDTYRWLTAAFGLFAETARRAA
jgi:hypothetical protein